MAKKTLQAVGDETVSFDDSCWWVGENVKRFLGNFSAGMEVEVTVKDIDGVPMVTFLKKAGFPTQPAGPRPQGAPQQGFGSPAPSYNKPAPSVPAPSNDGMYVLAAAIITAYQLDVEHVKEVVKTLKA